MTRPALALLAFLLATSAAAHDFWIEPSTFHPPVDGTVTASLRVGQQLHGDPVPRMPPLIERFVLRGPAGESRMLGRPGADPAGITRIAAPGLYWIGYQSNAYPLTTDAAKFESYLKEEGLERIAALRAKNGQSAAPGREQFYRCAKALLETPGAAAKGVFDTPLGFTLELVPRKNPYTMKSGGELPVALSFRGKPLANALVVAMNREHPDQPVRARTDAKGHVKLRLAHPGFWLVKAVHMEPAPAGSDADWESWWASVTFDLK
jgi:uncharacterized GH25 family protein